MKRSTILDSFQSRKWLMGILAAVFWVALWQIVSMAVGQELLVPAPLVVVKTWLRLAAGVRFWQSAGMSLLRVMLGFLAAVGAGCIFAVLTARFSLARMILTPVLHILRSVPVASFIILAMFWIKSNYLPVFIAFVMVLPVIWSNVEKGIQETSRELREMARVFQLGWWKTMRYIRIPSVMPYLMAASTTGLGFAWKSGVAAEVLSPPLLSIGKGLQEAKTYLEMPEVFAWTATVVALSILLEKVLLFTAQQLGKRYNTGL